MKNKSIDYSISNIIVLSIVFIVAIASIIIFQRQDPSVTGVFKSENCSLFTCPAPEPVEGKEGKPGGPGKKGDKGDTVHGKDGKNGLDGMCLANPFCEKGEKGDSITGKTGPPGKTIIGPEGPKGDDADPCIPCVNGINGSDSIVPGPPGICNCFNITDITFNNVDILETLTLTGNLTCPVGSYIDPNCLNLANCTPIFSGCDSQFSSITIKGGTPNSFLKIGAIGVHTGYVEFGNYLIPNSWLDYITMHSSTHTTISSQFSTQIRTTDGSVIIDAKGIANGVYVSGIGTVRLSSETEIDIVSQDFANIMSSGRMSLTSTTKILISTPSLNMTSDEIYISTSGSVSNWIVFNKYSSYLPSATTPMTPITAPSAFFGNGDLIIESGNILTLKADGFQTIGINVDIPGGKIKSSYANRLSMEHEIGNDVVGEPVVFHDNEGVKFMNGTKIFSDVGTDIDINTNNLLGETQTSIHGSVFTTNTLTVTDIVITGTLNGQVVTGTGPCCVSDRNMKNNIMNIEEKDSLDLVNKIETVEYRYKNEYLQENKWIRNTTKVGFIAQDLKKIIPNAVTKIKNIHNILVNELSVELLAHLVNSVKILNKRVIQLEKELELRKRNI